jgi:hypothetical protein
MHEVIKIKEIVPTKANIVLLADELAKGVKDGNISALEYAIKCKFIIEALSYSLKSINENILTELGTHGKIAELLGAKVEVKELGVKYDYSQDAKWCEINEQIQPLLTKLREQEERIKMATKIDASLIDEDTGELLATKVAKSSTSSYAVTLGK